ncbi:hypothetical protein OKA04_07375 [Luteolibacter flavescens]|uniref:SLA1 homology domain-containing protein n=1 Tax=Luteolibacter flavescens TaxID=1859460 RepID=A0ABT3FLW6_9BACT|nr:hypothetical protein [Luteolibacter flavescens]MCW1884548.1 hypothetical protein [Luteolibacter flavescens]
MKSILPLISGFALLLGGVSSGQTPQTPKTEPSRVWTVAKTGKGNPGTLVSKTADKSSIVIRMANGREVTVKTADLVQADKDYVAKWTSSVDAPPKGIVRGKASTLAQAQGGKSRVMEDLQSVLSHYGTAKEDTDTHPDAIIYKGPAWYEGGPEITIPYLMPVEKALALLVERPGPASRRPAVAPGFPPGMGIFEYDIRSGAYNRMFIVVDQANQVVALQAKSENKNDPAVPTRKWNRRDLPMNSTSDFLEPRTGGARCHVHDLRKSEKRIVIDLEAKGETLLFLPAPMVNLCLFHLAEDLRKR